MLFCLPGHPSAGLLVPVPPTSDEYWQVFERLRAPSDPSHQTPGSNKGGLNDVCEIRMPLPTKNLLKEVDGLLRPLLKGQQPIRDLAMQQPAAFYFC